MNKILDNIEFSREKSNCNGKMNFNLTKFFI